MGLPPDEELISRSVRLAGELLAAARAGGTRAGGAGDNGRGAGGPAGRGRRGRGRQERLRRLLADPAGTGLVFSLTDRVLRPVDPRVAVEQLRAVTRGDLSALSPPDRALLRLGARAGRVAPAPVAALAAARMRHETSGLVYPAEPGPLGRSLARLAAAGRHPNLNILGEAVLGWGEAERRTAGIEALLERPDVDCVSVKASAVAPSPSLVDFEGSVERAAEPLRRLYRRAASCSPPKLVNLDMEEHRDLDLTVELFTRVLDEPEFRDLAAGLALQAYLPDSHAALNRVLEWAQRRRAGGGAPVRIRLVKGANLAMERVDAELHGWPLAPYPSKADTDASYKAMLERLVTAAAAGDVRVGVASHNLFDVALALVMADALGGPVEIEMLAGMADEQAGAVAARTGGVLLYVPVTSRADFRTAMAYLARRLDENTTPEGFLRHVLDLQVGAGEWEEQADRFARAVGGRHSVGTAAHQGHDRTRPECPPGGTGFANEADTDLTVPANRAWARAALTAPARPAPADATGAEVEAALARARDAAPVWAGYPGPERRALLYRAARVMAAGRADAVAVMAAEAGKTFAEADPEVSEAVDYARWYGEAAEVVEGLASPRRPDGPFGPGPTATGSPLGVVVVASPWNFPYAIPAGGVLAALAAGNTVILKPSPEARATGAVLVEQLREAGLPPGAVQLVTAPDDEAGRRLVSGPGVDGVVLTGSWDTAVMMAGWAPGRRLLAETSGKNALVVAATADVDQAVRDLVRSSFGHAGQKCSAASLAIVEASVHDRSPFLRQLADAVRSLRVGPATDPATEVGPLVGPMTPALERALTTLDPGERWLVEPRRLGERLWSPGVRTGVRPGSWAHRTEWFGPVLGIMRARDLDQAVAWQNSVDHGLTAGLASLDPDEHRRWVDAVEAGNLYINRTTTGAIVGRQPFGGWKRSSLGPTAKAGGPDYLLGLRRWRDAGATSPEEAAADYRRWWSLRFSVAAETARLVSESNELRHRPFRPGVTVRVGPEVDDGELAKAEAAARVCGTPLRISSPGPRRAPGDVPVEVESAEALAHRLAGAAGPGAGGPPRLRVLGPAEEELRARAVAAGVAVLDEPMCSHGRVELPRWLREQTITRSLHRYGNVVYPRLHWGGEERP